MYMCLQSHFTTIKPAFMDSLVTWGSVFQHLLPYLILLPFHAVQ